MSLPGVGVRMGSRFFPNLLTNALYAAFFFAVRDESSLVERMKFYLQSILKSLARTKTAFLKHFSQFSAYLQQAKL